MTEKLFLKKYNQLPEQLKLELHQFLEFLLFQYQMKYRGNTFSDSAKKKTGYHDKPDKATPKAGFLKGTFEMSGDFDEPLS